MSVMVKRNLPWIIVAFVAVVLLGAFWGALATAYDELVLWMFTKQREFHRSMTASLSALADENSFNTAYAVVVGSFLYGVFHAAGPGHGKVVLSTYLVAKPTSVSKSLFMGFAAALLQAVVAIVLVYGLFYIFGLAPKDSRFAALWSERLSFALVMGLGVLLVWRAYTLAKTQFGTAAHDHKHDHAHHHGHDHDHHHHHIEDGVCSHCGHAHVPDVQQVENAVDLKSMLGVIFTIGIRPCSGAVLVLIFAKFASIPMAGVMGVFAMAVGTAITVSALALLAVKGRNVAQKLLAADKGASVWFGSATAALSGIVLLLVGYGLLAGSFSAPVRSMGLG